MIPISIPTDYVNPGLESLRLECPWIVPDAAHFINKYLNKTQTVLDLGSGGSSMFYARRCLHVYAIETEEPWFNYVSTAITKNQLENTITYNYYPGTDSIIKNFNFNENTFDVISVDTQLGTNRTALLELALPKLKKDGIIILDNWGYRKLFPKIYFLSPELLIEKYNLINYSAFDFTDPAWLGNGTRILISNKFLK